MMTITEKELEKFVVAKLDKVWSDEFGIDPSCFRQCGDLQETEIDEPFTFEIGGKTYAIRQKDGSISRLVADSVQAGGDTGCWPTVLTELYWPHPPDAILIHELKTVNEVIEVEARIIPETSVQRKKEVWADGVKLIKANTNYMREVGFVPMTAEAIPLKVQREIALKAFNDYFLPGEDGVIEVPYKYGQWSTYFEERWPGMGPEKKTDNGCGGKNEQQC